MLVVDADPDWCALLASTLESDFAVHQTDGASDALQVARSVGADVIVAEADDGGLDLLSAMSCARPKSSVIMASVCWEP